MATTNRILAYSKGLVENGARVSIFNPFPTDNHIEGVQDEKNEGVYEGISYIYTSGRYLPRSKWIRACLRVTGIKRVVGYITSVLKIAEKDSENSIDWIIISTDEIRSLLVFSIMAKILRIRSVFIFDEYPIPIRHKLKETVPKWKEIFYSWVLRHIDAYISISENLKAYYCSLSIKPTHVLSVIVDTSRFKNAKRNEILQKQKYLCYMGNLELSKDDVDNIIRAFAIVVQKYPDFRLWLFGPVHSENVFKLKNLIKKLNIEEKVEFKGQVSSLEVPSILANAHILVSSQPDTKRASGGFPTKLGEYLSTGVPSLFTDVGENSRYVKDGEHVFLARPENSKDYACKLFFIIENYESAVKIARQGKTFIQNNYSHLIKGKEILSFLKALK